jgi:predicted TIM-barrel enzyme
MADADAGIEVHPDTEGAVHPRGKPGSGTSGLAARPGRACLRAMPNPWTGKGNPYTREEVRERLHAKLRQGRALIAAGAGTGISAKFIEKGGADLIIIYNSGRFRMMGHGSTAGMMAYGDANAIAMEIGEYEVLPVVEEVPVICGVHATDPRRRMWHWLGRVKEMGFSGVNNFPTHTIVDGHFRGVLEETGMSVRKEYEMVALARRMDLFSIVYVGSPEEAVEMAKAGADAIIAHVGTTVGGSIGVQKAVVSWEHTLQTTRDIIAAASQVRKDIFFLAHGGPINTPEDADRVIRNTDAVGFVGASSLERMGVEDSLTSLTRRFTALELPRRPAPGA